MTIQQAYQQLFTDLQTIYDESEAANIADWVMEYLTGQRKPNRGVNQEVVLTPEQQARFTMILQQLLGNIPIQYVLNEAWFAGMKLFVDENVLIPRPETEELVDWVSGEVKSQKSKYKNLIDIGTGSGCIPIALKKKHPDLNVRALDVSEGALNVAVKNAMLQGTQVYFMRMDFLDKGLRESLGRFDIIVSNPPYVKQSEAGAMHKNVLDHEPHLALFVPDDDALLFYREIAAFGKTHLNAGGLVFLEINEALGVAVQQLFSDEGYAVELKKDMQGKDRMVKAWRKN